MKLQNGFALLHLFILVFVIVLSLPALAAEVSEKELVMRINDLRGLKLPKDQSEIEKMNKRLDSTWKFFKDNKEKAIPILKKELEAQLLKKESDNYFLLDVGLFLFSEDEIASKDLALRALKKLDPSSEMIQADFRRIFNLTLGIASSHEKGILEVIDNVFLRAERKVIVPEHYLTLDPTLTCVYLYGIYGPDSEDYLVNKLEKEPVHVKRVLEILNWIGTERSFHSVRKIMISQPNYETFVRSIGYFLRLGGAEGRRIVLDMDMRRFDARSREYYEKIKLQAEEQTYQTFYKSFESLPGDKTLSDDVLKQRLRAMCESYGKENTTNPLAVLNSKAPIDDLIAELVKIRSRMFYRVSDEALYDVQVTNTLIDALLYKKQAVFFGTERQLEK